MPSAATTAATDRSPTKKRGSTRSKMLLSAAEVLRETGAAGVTIDEVLARSGAPRGSVYYHFPDGRNQLLTEALQFAGDSITAVIDEAAATRLHLPGPQVRRVLGADPDRQRLHRRVSGGGGGDRILRRRPRS